MVASLGHGLPYRPVIGRWRAHGDGPPALDVPSAMCERRPARSMDGTKVWLTERSLPAPACAPIRVRPPPTARTMAVSRGFFVGRRRGTNGSAPRDERAEHGDRLVGWRVLRRQSPPPG